LGADGGVVIEVVIEFGRANTPAGGAHEYGAERGQEVRRLTVPQRLSACIDRIA